MHGNRHSRAALAIARAAVMAVAGRGRGSAAMARRSFAVPYTPSAVPAPVAAAVSTGRPALTAASTVSSSSWAALSGEVGAMEVIRGCGRYAALLAILCGSRAAPTPCVKLRYLSRTSAAAATLLHTHPCTLTRAITSAALRSRASPLVGVGGGDGLPMGLSTAVWVCQRRHASGVRRPTLSEIGESLAVFGYGNVNFEEKELKSKYRELVKRNHPDTGGDEKTMARIAVAYERLRGLTRREREEFQAHQNAFSGRMRAGGGRASSPYQDHRYAHQNPQRAGGFHQQTPSGFGSQYYQQGNYPGGGGAQESAYWSYYHRMHQQQQQQGANGRGGGGFAENPFTSRNPFSFYTQAQRIRFSSASSLLVQGMVLYLFLSVMFLFAYRAIRDYLHEDGWRMSDSLARHEQMQELHRLRQEMSERAQLHREMQQQQPRGADPGHAYFYDTRPAGAQLNPHVRDTPEQRALEYARQRRVQIMEEQRRLASAGAPGGQATLKEANSNLLSVDNSLSHLPEMKGWPRISAQEGRIIKRAQDPPGVVFFEPRPVDARARQIYNRVRGAERSAAWGESPPPPPPPSQSPSPPASSPPAAAPAGKDPPSVGAGDPRGPLVGAPVGGADGQAAGAPPLPESNVGSVFAAQVKSNADAREAMNTIFGVIREARARSSA